MQRKISFDFSRSFVCSFARLLPIFLRQLWAVQFSSVQFISVRRCCRYCSSRAAASIARRAEFKFAAHKDSRVCRLFNLSAGVCRQSSLACAFRTAFASWIVCLLRVGIWQSTINSRKKWASLSARCSMLVFTLAARCRLKCAVSPASARPQVAMIFESVAKFAKTLRLTLISLTSIPLSLSHIF